MVSCSSQSLQVEVRAARGRGCSAGRWSLQCDGIVIVVVSEHGDERCSSSVGEVGLSTTETDINRKKQAGCCSSAGLPVEGLGVRRLKLEVGLTGALLPVGIPRQLLASSSPARRQATGPAGRYLCTRFFSVCTGSKVAELAVKRLAPRQPQHTDQGQLPRLTTCRHSDRHRAAPTTPTSTPPSSPQARQSNKRAHSTHDDANDANHQARLTRKPILLVSLIVIDLYTYSRSTYRNQFAGRLIRSSPKPLSDHQQNPSSTHPARSQSQNPHIRAKPSPQHPLPT